MNDKRNQKDNRVASNDELGVASAMKRIVQRRPGNSYFVYDRATRTIRIKGQQGEDKGNSGLKLHDV